MLWATGGNFAYDFIWFWAMGGNFAYDFTWFWATGGNFAYEFIGLWAMDGNFAYELIGFSMLSVGTKWVQSPMGSWKIQQQSNENPFTIELL